YHPERMLFIVAPILVLFSRMFTPLVLLVHSIASRLLKAFDKKLPTGKEMVLSAEQLSELWEERTEAGELDESESEMIQSVFDFGDTLVREVMSPRKDIIAVKEDAELDEVVDAFTVNGYSRVLVQGDELDDIRGVLLAKDLMPYVGEQANGFSVRKI